MKLKIKLLVAFTFIGLCGFSQDPAAKKVIYKILKFNFKTQQRIKIPLMWSNILFNTSVCLEKSKCYNCF